MTDAVITLDRLTKRYGHVQALTDVSVDFPPGSVGLLGPNGAGKTTMIKLLLGLLRPTSGNARVAGCNPRKRRDRLEVRRRVGYMPEGDCLMPQMTGIELVTYLGRITGLSRQDAMTRAHEMLDYVELEEARYRGLVEYSTGMKQRLKLAQALVHDPPVLLLDEPTNGLDPKGRRHMLDLIHDLGHAQGKNVLMCSHLLRDVERTCDHVVVLNAGQVVQSGSIEHMTSGDGLRVRVRIGAPSSAFSAGLAQAGFHFDDQGAGKYIVDLQPAMQDADEIFAIAAEHGCSIHEVDEVRSTLEDIFLTAIGAAESPEKEGAA